MRVGIKEITNPLEVLECIVAFDVRDYGTAKRDRMLYAIILGWDDASYKSFGWSEEEIKEFKQMRERFERLKEVDFSTADVVPKSEVESIITLNSQLEAKVFEERKEVERLKHILDCYALQYGTVKEQQDVIDKANQEFAREIFEEIESKKMFLKDHAGNMGVVVLFIDLVDLKKKYTEGEQ